MHYLVKSISIAFLNRVISFFNGCNRWALKVGRCSASMQQSEQNPCSVRQPMQSLATPTRMFRATASPPH